MARRPRAVLDTNVFVSALINPNGPPADILRALRSKRFTLISSPPINYEIMAVLNRPYIRDRYQLGDAIFDVGFLLWEVADVVITLPDVKVSRDAADDKFLATAIAGKANYLVSGDIADLLSLKQYEEVAIVSPRQFLSILGG